MNSALLLSIVCITIIGVLSRPSHEPKRLIKTSEEDAGEWLDMSQILLLKLHGVGFVDITDRTFPKPGTLPTHAQKEIPVTLEYQTVVNNAISHVNIQRTEAFLQTFSSYFNRYYTTDNGEQSALWLLSEIQNSIGNSRYNGIVSGATFAHSWRQPSIIARIEGSDPILKDEIVILGAHLDSMNSGNPVNGGAPGADDNGSGSSVLLEAFRALLDSDFVPKRTIEFQWYAAEEVGLRGSGDIAEAYYTNGVNVFSMMNFDVSGYFSGREEIAIVTDYTDSSLTTFLRVLIDGYLDFTWSNKRCFYACSDHASFDSYNFRSAFPVEVVFHPNMHTTGDTIDKVNFIQIREFTKLAVGYAIEVAQPSS